MVKASIDFETRGVVDLRKTGVHRYAEDEATEALCCAFAVDDGPVQIWQRGDDDSDIKHVIKHADILRGHNFTFERIITNLTMRRRHGWPEIQVERGRCSMVEGLALGLPASLDDMAAAVGLPIKKDMVGRRLMLSMCKPRAPKKHEAPGVYWRESEAEIERLAIYCKSDVEVERELSKRLLPLSKDELALWFLDAEINDRGLMVDAELAKGAVKIVDRVTEALNRRMVKVSELEVRGITDRAGLLRFAKQCGCPDVESLAKDQLAILLLRDDLDAQLRECLEIRQEGAKASVAKVEALLRGRCADGRVRGLLQFNAANTRRWGGRRFQPQNLKRPQTSKKWIPGVIDAVRRGEWTSVDELFYGPALSAIGDVTRGMIQAEEGKQLTAADYSNIEGRVLAWLAGEQWKLDAFRAFDNGTGPDLYKLAYARSFGALITSVTDFMRQIGKVMELALGYQGGVGAFLAMAKGYGLNVGEFYDVIRANAPEAFETATKSFDFRGKQSGTAARTWIAAETLKRLWRAAHPAIVDFWDDIEDAALRAVHLSGSKVNVGPLAFLKRGSFLFMRLPSGGVISYPYPEVREVPYFNDTKQALTFKTVPDPLKPLKILPEADGSINMRWARISTYGGMLAENATQAVARDILANGMTNLAADGWPIVLHVHDEIVAESERAGGPNAFVYAMSALPPCYDGLPITAAGFQAKRYRK